MSTIALPDSVLGPPAGRGHTGGMTVEERIATYLDRTPSVDPSAYIATGAVVRGAVTLDPESSVWHHCVLRGDINTIEVGRGTNIQDGTVVHLADDRGVSLGEYVTVGHAAMIHACTVGDACLIGMKATVLDGARIGARSIVGAGALVTKGTEVPEGSLVLGAPAKVVRSLSEEEQEALPEWAEKYVVVAREHKRRFGNAPLA